MDMGSWKKVLLQWVTECGFMDRNYFNIEQTDIDIFYLKFSSLHPKTGGGKYKRISDFLREFYPLYEFHCDDENCLSSADYIYVYSMLLHFCCVRYPETVFHEICQRLPEYAQQCIASFFKDLIDIETLSKESLRHAIAHVASSNQTPPRFNESFASSQSESSLKIGTSGSACSTSLSSGSIPSPNFMRFDSPLKTPKRSAGPQRISPTTPKSYLLEERTRELYNLKATLETERYEKGLLEVQIKQNDDIIFKLNQDHKKLTQQIQDLKNDLLIKSSEISCATVKEDEGQIRKRLLKDLAEKESELNMLTESVRGLREENTFVQDKLEYAETQIVVCMNRIKDLDFKLDELNDEIEKKNDTIKYLEDSKLELEQFIRETRSSSNVPIDLNSSVDCFDSSFARNVGTNNSSSNINSPDNLGVSVVDVKLREKEHENSKLKEELEVIKNERKILASNLYDIAERHAKELDLDIEDLLSELEESESQKEFGLNENPIEQLDRLSCCLEKIGSYCKFDKQKIRDIKIENQKLQEMNKDLTNKLDVLTTDMLTFKKSMTRINTENDELQNSKKEMQISLDRCAFEIEHLREQKQQIYIELQKVTVGKECLMDNLNRLQTELYSAQAQNTELLEESNGMKDKCRRFQLEVEDLATFSAQQADDLHMEIKRLTEALSLKAKETDAYMMAEQTMKGEHEQILVENEELKQKVRDVNIHVDEMKIVLKEKQDDIDKLGNEIDEFTLQNQALEDKFEVVVQQCQAERLASEKAAKKYKEEIAGYVRKIKNMEANHLQECLQLKSEHHQEVKRLQGEILQLQEAVDATNDLSASKSKEKEKIYKVLYDEVTPKVSQLLELLKAEIKDDCLENINALVKEVTHLQEQYSESLNKINTLELEHQESCNQVERLLKELAKKTEVQSKLNQECNDYKSTIEVLKDQQQKFMDKVKEHDQELNDRNLEACKEYEASIERIHVELRCEKEHHKRVEGELFLVISEHNDVKRQLAEKDQNIQKLREENSLLLGQQTKINLLESRVAEYSQENEMLKKEIDLCKDEVNDNAKRLVEADNALTELIAISKDYDLKREKLQEVTSLLQQKENALQKLSDGKKELELKLKEQEGNISELMENLKSLQKDKEQLLHEIEDCAQQIKQVNEEKSLLLSSLEKSADQSKLAIEEKEKSISLEQKYIEAKEKLEVISLQNTKLKGDLLEHEALLRMYQEDQELERQKYQDSIKSIQKQLLDTSERMDAFDMELMEVLAKMENNFNLAKKSEIEGGLKNVFNFQHVQDKDDKLNELRHNLNLVFYFDAQLQTDIKELSLEIAKKSKSVEDSKKAINDLQVKLKVQDIELGELREHVENEEVIVEKRIAQEIRRLEDDLQNLENVNERLTNGNFDMQVAMGTLEQDLKSFQSKLEKAEEEKLSLKEEVRTKATLLDILQEEDKKSQKILKENKHQLEALTETCTRLENQLKERNVKIKELEKNVLAQKTNYNKQQKKFTQQLQQMDAYKIEQKNLKDSLTKLHSTNDHLENELALKMKEILRCNNRVAELLQSLADNEQQLESTMKKLDESETYNLNNEAKNEQIISDNQQLLRDLELLRAQHEIAADESQRLVIEIENLKQDKHQLREELRDTKSELQRSNDNVSQLIQQVSSIRFEKESLVEDYTLLKQQVEETGKHHSSSESKLKSYIEKSQDFERKLLTAENELKSVKSLLEKTEFLVQKLGAENTKLRESQEASTKRIEKLALKLGDSQARSTKLERDNEKLSKTLESNAATVEALQREKDMLQNEAKQLKERMSRAERSHEQLVTKVKNLENMNTQLQETKKALETSEIDVKTKVFKLEKIRDSLEDKLRKVSNSLHTAENVNVKLNLEVGALNSHLQEFKLRNPQELVQDLNQKVEALQQDCCNYEDQTVKLELQLLKMKEEKSALSDQLSKAMLSLQMHKDKCSELTEEMERVQEELDVALDEKSKAEVHDKISTQKLKNLEMKNDTLLQQRQGSIAALESRISTLEEKLSEKCKEVDGLQQEIHSLQEVSQTYESNLQKFEQAIPNNSAELDMLREKLSKADQTLAREQETISQLKLDNQILHTKYQESKQKALDAALASEERIKDNRLELERKLDKMKNKMKTLYTEEITKMKTKQERESAIIKSEMEVVKTQNTKYEEHIRKLSNQIVRLNENILEYQKENTILSTKLKHLVEQHHDAERFKRPSAIHVSTVSSSSGLTAANAAKNIGTNLAMEDEEGEIFNNTYLTDLKTGQMSDFMSRDVCAEELKYRNSLLPPHLKSSYAAQFDHDCAEDDLKDLNSMDDSMSALLSTTASGTRKKSTGFTHYKRPGPPTPSKNGRLSLGGISSEPTREILKESFDNNAVSSSKTPARFTFFGSRFSMGKDENTPPKRRLSNMFKRK